MKIKHIKMKLMKKSMMILQRTGLNNYLDWK